MIRLQFSSDGTWGDIAIRDYTWSRWGHVEFLLDDGTLLGTRPQHYTVNGVVVPSGMQIRPAGYTHFRDLAICTVPGLNAEQEAKILSFAKAQIGTAYNWLADAGCAAHEDWSTPGTWQCGMVTHASFMEAYPLLYQPRYNRVTPEDLWESPLIVHP